jgi:hypothetical protein
MKQKAEVRLSNAEGSEGLVRRSLSRARVQLSQTVASALAPAREGEEAHAGPRPKARETAFSRMRELLEQDRVRLAKQGGGYVPDSAKAAAPARAETARSSPPPLPQAKAEHALPPPAPARRAAAAAAATAAAAAPTEDSPSDPIRTRTMARLLAIQGYRKRALSIYDELLARDANDEGLRAEADRLRS